MFAPVYIRPSLLPSCCSAILTKQLLLSSCLVFRQLEAAKGRGGTVSSFTGPFWTLDLLLLLSPCGHAWLQETVGGVVIGAALHPESEGGCWVQEKAVSCATVPGSVPCRVGAQYVVV